MINLIFLLFFFFFNDTATTEIYTLSLHDALPISPTAGPGCNVSVASPSAGSVTRCSLEASVPLTTTLYEKAVAAAAEVSTQLVVSMSRMVASSVDPGPLDTGVNPAVAPRCTSYRSNTEGPANRDQCSSAPLECSNVGASRVTASPAAARAISWWDGNPTAVNPMARTSTRRTRNERDQDMAASHDAAAARAP